MQGDARDDARAELDAYFGTADAARGWRAAPLNPDHLGGVFDEFASRRAHWRHFEPQHRLTMAKCERVEWVLWGLPRTVQLTLQAAFSPPTSGVTVGTRDSDRPSLSVLSALTYRKACLFNIVVTMPETVDIMRASTDGRAGSSRQEVLRFLEDNAHHARKGSCLPRLATIAEEHLAPAIDRYVSRRAEWIAHEKNQRTARINRLVERLRAGDCE